MTFYFHEGFQRADRVTGVTEAGIVVADILARDDELRLTSRQPKISLCGETDDVHEGPSLLVEVSHTKIVQEVVEKARSYATTKYSNVQTVICLHVSHKKVVVKDKNGYGVPGEVRKIKVCMLRRSCRTRSFVGVHSFPIFVLNGIPF